MWRSIFEIASGRLVSTGSIFVDPLPPGLSFKEYADRPDIEGVMWDEVNLDWIPRPPKVLIDRMDDLEGHPTFLQFQDVFNTLTSQQKTKVRNAIRMMLGTERFRTVNEDLEIGK